MADSSTTHASRHNSPGVGARVEVKTRFDGTWSRGFEVADVEDDGLRIKRMTDGSVLPSLFRPNEVRRERHPTW